MRVPEVAVKVKLVAAVSMLMVVKLAMPALAVTAVVPKRLALTVFVPNATVTAELAEAPEVIRLP